jgi:phosphoribosylamine--glycine ligase
MGAYAPAPIFTAEMRDEALTSILKPVINGLKSEGTSFVGVIYAGLMLTRNGIRVLEFNSRFGDPEAQVVLPLLETDLLEIVDACVNGYLADMDIRWKKGVAVCVVMAGNGYPEKVESGKLVTIGALPENVICFHAGTKTENGNILTSGGRVLGLTAWAEDIKSAIKGVYVGIQSFSFAGMQYRKDIARKVLKTDWGTDLING